jgi:hypothetical protein
LTCYYLIRKLLNFLSREKLHNFSPKNFPKQILKKNSVLLFRQKKNSKFFSRQKNSELFFSEITFRKYFSLIFERSAQKWKVLCKVKGDQICTWWMMFESSSTNGGKGTCENVSTPTLKSVFARGEIKY